MCSRLSRSAIHRPGRLAASPWSSARCGMSTTTGANTVRAAAAVTQQSGTTAAHAVTEKLLADETYHIEFCGYLSNHAKHAVIGLYGLQAPPEMIQKYWDMYTNEVPYGLTLEPAHTHSGQPLTAEDLEGVLGQKKQYPELVELFEREVRELEEDKVLLKYAPVLLPGMVAALTHGIIHLGWALDFGSPRMIIEGLAYMAYTCVSVHPERFQHSALEDALPTDSLIRAAQLSADQNVPESIQNIKDLPKYSREAGWRPELYDSGFQWQLSKVLEEGHDIFLKLPQWLDVMPVGEALEGMYKAVTLLYLVSAGEPGERKDGNFVVLHLITSLWGAEQVLRRLPEEQHRHVLKCYWASMNAVVATLEAGFPPAATLESAWKKYQAAVDSPDMHDGTSSSTGAGGDGPESERRQDVEGVQAWEVVIARAWGEDEEHNIKLVYVCRELWRRYGHWRGFRAAAETFIVTPSGVGPNATVVFSA